MNKLAQVRSGHSLISTLLILFWRYPIYFSFKSIHYNIHTPEVTYLYLFLHPLCQTVWAIADEKTWGKFEELSQGQNCSCPNSPRLFFLTGHWGPGLAFSSLNWEGTLPSITDHPGYLGLCSARTPYIWSESPLFPGLPLRNFLSMLCLLLPLLWMPPFLTVFRVEPNLSLLP